MPEMPYTLPQAPHERIVFLDVLRGLAILGIFIANLEHFSGYSFGPLAPDAWMVSEKDGPLLFLIHWLVEGKFYSIFSLLFGWGMALQLRRNTQNGINALSLMRRRLGFMLLLGGIHLLIWQGDIVFFYALLGFLFLPLRHLSNKNMLILAACLLLLPIPLYWLKMLFPILQLPAQWPAYIGGYIQSTLLNIQSFEGYLQVVQQASLREQFYLNLGDIFYRYSYLFQVSRIPKVLGMFLMGFVLGRLPLFTLFQTYKKQGILLILGCLALGLPFNYLLAYSMEHYSSEYYSFQPKGLTYTIYYALGVAPLALAYTGLILWAFQSKTMQKLFGILAPVGKMAFSNYVLQSLIGLFIFLPIGLGYWGQMGPVYYTVLGVCIFLMQLAWSTWWLCFFNYGPIEWLWRRLTYGKSPTR